MVIADLQRRATMELFKDNRTLLINLCLTVVEKGMSSGFSKVG